MTNELRINLTFKLPDEAVQALLEKHPGLAILRLQDTVEKVVRRRLNEQLRKLLSELGGDPWHYFLKDPREESTRPKREGAMRSMRATP